MEPLTRNPTKTVKEMAFYTLVQCCKTFSMKVQMFIVQLQDVCYKSWCCSHMVSATLSSHLFIRHVNVDPARISRVSLDNQSSRILGYSPTMILTFVTKFDKWQCTAVGLNSNFNQSTSI